MTDDLDEDGFFGLYAEEPVLSGDSRFLREAGIKFGRITTGLTADDDLPEAVRWRADLLRWRFDKLTIPFELQFVRNGKYYVEAEVKLSFVAPVARSVEFLSPDSRGLEPHVSLVTTAVGQRDLGWLLASTDTRLGIGVGGWQVQAVVESPLDTATLAGTLDARAKVVSRTTRRIISKDVRFKAPRSFTLGVIEGNFAFCEGSVHGPEWHQGCPVV